MYIHWSIIFYCTTKSKSGFSLPSLCTHLPTLQKTNSTFVLINLTSNQDTSIFPQSLSTAIASFNTSLLGGYGTGHSLPNVNNPLTSLARSRTARADPNTGGDSRSGPKHLKMTFDDPRAKRLACLVSGK